jgi:hypothetical protein
MRDGGASLNAGGSSNSLDPSGRRRASRSQSSGSNESGDTNKLVKRASRSRSNEKRRRSPSGSSSGSDDIEESEEDRGNRYKEKHRSSGGRKGDRDYRRDKSQSRDRRTREYRSPSFSDPLLHYKAFCEMQRHSYSKEEFQRLYDEYKADYEEHHAQIFFKEHQNDCWFREKYDPVVSSEWDQERKNQSRALAEKFVEYFIDDVSAGSIRGLMLDQDVNYDYDKLITSKNDEVARAPIFGYDANLMTLYLRSIPKNVSRRQLLEVIRGKTDGFVSLSMSEPLKT